MQVTTQKDGILSSVQVVGLTCQSATIWVLRASSKLRCVSPRLSRAKATSSAHQISKDVSEP